MIHFAERRAVKRLIFRQNSAVGIGGQRPQRGKLLGEGPIDNAARRGMEPQVGDLGALNPEWRREVWLTGYEPERPN